MDGGMGFENRKAARIKTDLNLCYWQGGSDKGPAVWGQSINLSESGLAFHAPAGLNKSDIILLEFSLPGRDRPLRLFGEVVHSEREASARHHSRIKFLDLQSDELQLLRRHVLLVSDPAMASSMDWGKVYFPNRQSIPVSARELSASEQKQCLDGAGGSRRCISIKETSFLRHFQEFLEASFGSRVPGNFRMLGSKAFHEHSSLWLELQLPEGPLQGLAEVLWSRREDGGEARAESGLIWTGFEKQRAIQLEKSGSVLVPL
jgi:hypothetical protein